MKNIIGLTEYTVTGGFLWLIMFFFLTLAGWQAQEGASIVAVWDGWLSPLAKLGSPVGNLQPIIKESFGIVLGGFLLIGVFCTGLLLDILGPVIFASWEILWLRRWIGQQSDDWLIGILSTQNEFIRQDYEQFTHSAPLAFFGQRGRHQRLISFMQSYALASSNASQIEDLSERLRILRISRSLAVALLASALLLMFLVYVPGKNASYYFQFHVVFALSWVLAFLSWFIARASFYRVFVTLQVLAYLAWKPSQHGNTAQSGEANEAVKK